MTIPFTKAHGARNDFLLTWAAQAPEAEHLPRAAEAICDRNSGVGADGWLLVYPPSQTEPARIRLFNPDGGEVEMSGNGTRCAAAFLIEAGLASNELAILTGGGRKHLTLLNRNGPRFAFAMNMGSPDVIAKSHILQLSRGPREATLLNVGNPQCAFFVQSFDFDWKSLGQEVEHHADFPNRTNVSFVRVVDPHRIDVRFWERGAGFTQSSGTGSTGAMVAAVTRGVAQSPVTVDTLAGPLEFQWDGGDVHMQGPAVLAAAGEFYFD